MALVRTDLRNTRESAKRISFRPGPPLAATNVQDAIDEIAAATYFVNPVQIDNGDSPYAVPLAVTLIWVDTSAGAVEIDLPTGADRLGKPLEIKDITGDALANNITIDPSAGETVDDLDPLLIDMAFGGYRLYPKPTGGWTTAPSSP